MFHDTPIITKLYIEVCNINMHSDLYLIIPIRSKIIGVLPVIAPIPTVIQRVRYHTRSQRNVSGCSYNYETLHCGLQYKYAFRLDLKLLGCYPTSPIPTFNGDIKG